MSVLIWALGSEQTETIIASSGLVDIYLCPMLLSKYMRLQAAFNFFGQMQDLMHPENSNAHGRAMRQAMGVDN